MGRKCVAIYRRSEKIRPPTKIGNVLFGKSHPKYEYDKISRCLLRKRSRFDPRSPHHSDLMCRFVRKIGKNL